MRWMRPKKKEPAAKWSPDLLAYVDANRAKLQAAQALSARHAEKIREAQELYELDRIFLGAPRWEDPLDP